MCLYTGGFESSKVHAPNALDLEIQRRRFWACYLMQCTLGESLVVFDPIADVAKVTLPWPEADFTAGVMLGLNASLESDGSSGGIYAELVKVLTLWYAICAHCHALMLTLEVGRRFSPMSNHPTSMFVRVLPEYTLLTAIYQDGGHNCNLNSSWSHRKSPPCPKTNFQESCSLI